MQSGWPMPGSSSRRLEVHDGHGQEELRQALEAQAVGKDLPRLGRHAERPEMSASALIALAEATGVPAFTADNPQLCVAKGTGIALENLDSYKRSIFSS